jgi:hypothetical protein
VTGVGDDLYSPQRSFEWRVWLGPVSCALAIAGLVSFFSTTTLNLNASFGGPDNSSFGFSFVSGMDLWFHISVMVLFVVGGALGTVGISRAPRFKALAWFGTMINGLCVVLLAAFIGFAIAQGAFLG